uniref:Uncharacterized protein n=1 Tax=Glossina morsitans morsitans TaxID=37546 RepID=A0A1B0FBI1_GLOMM
MVSIRNYIPIGEGK